MLRRLGCFSSCRSFVSHSTLCLSPVAPLLEVVTFGQRRCLASSLRPPSFTRKEDAGKIAPLGWFLLLIPATTFGLGCWQVKRKAWKERLISELAQLSKTPPVPLPDNLSAVAQLEYRLVTVRGQFLYDREVLLGPRSLIRPDGAETAGGLFSQRDAGGNGYLVVTPFKLADRDDVILINRGWVPRKHKGQSSPDSTSQQQVEVTAVVRAGEQRPQFSPNHKGDDNIFLYRDLPKMCAQTGATAGVFLDAIYDAASPPGGPVGGQTRNTLRNEHLSYLITWFSLSAATALLWYRRILKRPPPL